MKQLIDIRNFVGAGMNLDVEEIFLKPNEYRQIFNTRLISSEGSHIGSAENLPGNTKITNFNHTSYTLPDGHNRTVGYGIDKENKTIYYLLYNSNAHHCILRYNITDNSIDHILYDCSLLNFQPSILITHVNILGGMLFWTFRHDNGFSDYSPPRMIDIEKAYNYTNSLGSSPLNRYALITQQILDRIKYPPLSPPEINYYRDEDYNKNNLRGKLFQFKYRYVYDNNEISVFSPVSKVALPEGEMLLIGEYLGDQTINNRIDVRFNTGSYEVYRIEIAAREGNTGHWKTVKTFDKYTSNGGYLYDSSGSPLVTNSEKVYYFYNDTIGDTLDQENAARLYDFIPQISGCQDIIEKNRLIDADITEGYDNVHVNVELTPISEWVEMGEQEIEMPRRGDMGDLRWYDVYYYESQFFYFDLASREGTGHVVPIVTGNVYRLKLYADNDIGIGGAFPSGTIIQYDYIAQEGDEYIDIRDYFINKINSQQGFATPPYGKTSEKLATDGDDEGMGVSNFLFYVRYNLKEEHDPPNWQTIKTYFQYQTGIFYIYPPVKSYPSFKAGAWYPYGLVYYDRANRQGAVNVSNSSEKTGEVFYGTTCQIPEYIAPETGNTLTHKNKIKWKINHNPPEGATHYQWVCAMNTSVSWFQYFVLHEQDVVWQTTYISILINRLLKEQIENNPKINRSLYNDWEKGDRIKFIASFNWTSYQYDLFYELFDVEIDELGLDEATGVYDIRLFNFDMARVATGGFRLIVEVYRPRKNLPEEDTAIFHEIGEKYDIVNGQHEITQGYFEKGDVYFRRIYGDTTALQRVNVESFDFSDYYDSVVCDIGRPQVIDKNMKRERYKSELRHGGLFVQNSKINDLCKFKAEDYETLTEKYGAITKLKEIGFTLKVLQEAKINSIFLGREELMQAIHQGATIIAGITEVLGSISPSDDNWGCQNPESVFTNGARMYFADVNNGAIIRSAPNGMFSISTYGINDHIKDLFNELSLSTSIIFGFYDGKYNEVCFSIQDQKTGGYIYDPIHKDSIIFIETPTNKWTFRDYWEEKILFGGVVINRGADMFASEGQSLISWMNGEFYLHDNNSLRGTFYNAFHPQYIEIPSNIEPLQDKIFDSIAYVSNKKWEYSGGAIIEMSIGATDNYPTGMFSKLMADNFVQYEGEYRAAILKDMFTDANLISPVADLKQLFNGRSMRGNSVLIKMINSHTEKTILKFVAIRSKISG